MNKTVQKAIRAEYVLLRTPLTLLDERVLTRLGEHSRIRTTVERGIATLDAAAAKLIDSPATPAAPATPATPATPPAEVIPADEVEELAEVLLAEEEQEHNLAGELAEDEELRRVQAALKAKHRVEEEHGR